MISRGEGEESKKRRRRGDKRKNFSPHPALLPVPPPLVCQLLSWWKPLGCTFVKKRTKTFLHGFSFCECLVKFLVHAFLSEKPYMTLLNPKTWQRGYGLLEKEFYTIASCLPQVILYERLLSCAQTVVKWIEEGHTPWFLQLKESKFREPVDG